MNCITFIREIGELDHSLNGFVLCPSLSFSAARNLNDTIMKTHGLSRHPLHDSWNRIKQRCYNPKNPGYHKYGGRGIGMCDEWRNNFMAFHNYVITLPNYGKEGYSIDRIKNDKGYQPGNMRWATKHEQSVNRRIQKINTSGFVGVSFNKQKGKWCAYITVKKKRIGLGAYGSAQEAAQARDKHIISNELSEYKIQATNFT